MDFESIFAVLGQEHIAGSHLIVARMQHALATFCAHPSRAISAIQNLRRENPPQFALAGVRVLLDAKESTPGLKYLAGLIATDAVFLDPLLDEDLLPLPAALELAVKVAAVDPLLDVQLLRRLLAQANGKVGEAPASVVLRALALVEKISDCSRLAPFLIQFMRHADLTVCSKAALMLGRANRNLPRTKRLMDAGDDRVRANALESLWGGRDSRTLEILREAAGDPCNRVAANALLGLCRAGDAEAASRLLELAEAPERGKRASAAWVMGETGDRSFVPALQQLQQDADDRVRAMAERSQNKLRAPVKEAAQPKTPPTPETSQPDRPVAPSPPQWKEPVVYRG